MKTRVLTILLCAFALHAQAGSAVWRLNPTTDDWNSATNWTPATVPNGLGDIATFNTSSRNNVTLSATTEVSEILFNSGASAFTITTKLSQPGNVLTVSGLGITNNSGLTQNLATEANGFQTSQIHFTNSASAGDGIVIINHGSPIAGVTAFTQFSDDATAGSATIVNEGVGVGGASGSGGTFFSDNSSAGIGTFINSRNPVGGSGYMYFDGNSSAADGTFMNDGTIFFFDATSAGNGVFVNNGQIVFYPDSNAANGVFTCQGGQASGYGGGGIFFDGNSDHATATVEAGAVSGSGGGSIQFDAGTAANGNFTLHGATVSGAGGAAANFLGPALGGEALFTLHGGTVSGAGGASLVFSQQQSSLLKPNAEDATIIANGGLSGGDGSTVAFWNSSKGGAARLAILGNSQLDVSYRPDRPLITIGSLEGEGTVFLGGSILDIGGNNLSTTFSGVIKEIGGLVDGAGGSIIKSGNGLLNLSGANTYTGTTTVNSGSLGITNRTGSATGPSAVTVAAGSIGGRGTIAGSLTVGTGSGNGASLAPALGTRKQNTLTVQGSLVLKADATYAATFQSRGTKVRSDRVVGNGVTLSGATISLQGTVQGTTPPGTQLTVVSNTAASPISGTFANLPDGGTIIAGSTTFQASYGGGDGNDLTLTVVP
ncbi:MAG: autotransporter-associated beta strand repeat-containing protein [Chthoniobacterales bacterium]